LAEGFRLLEVFDDACGDERVLYECCMLSQHSCSLPGAEGERRIAPHTTIIINHDTSVTDLRYQMHLDASPSEAIAASCLADNDTFLQGWAWEQYFL
jgi:hypothetical protein